MASNRERALEAAVTLLGTEGLRALTHARVDDRAGLPRGSTSNSFRTRAALLAGVVEWMVAQERPAVDTAVLPASPEEFIDGLCRLFDHLTGPGRVLTTARLVLYLEASRDPALREALAQGRRAMERAILPALARLGAADPQLAAGALAVCFEGLFLHRIARHADLDPRPVIELVVRAALAAPARPARSMEH